MINWKVRLRNKTFWVSIIPALLVLIQAILRIFNVDVFADVESEWIIKAIDALFIVLSMMGIVTDPTTEGLSDSARALNYEFPSSGEDWDSREEDETGETETTEIIAKEEQA